MEKKNLSGELDEKLRRWKDGNKKDDQGYFKDSACPSNTRVTIAQQVPEATCQTLR